MNYYFDSIMTQMMLSPSSINTFKQCPRKFYFAYICKYPTKPNIYTVKGNIVHKVLEKFFDIDVTGQDLNTIEGFLKSKVKEIYRDTWKNYLKDLMSLEKNQDELKENYMDSFDMLMNWTDNFTSRLISLSEGRGLENAYRLLTPKRELFLSSKEHSVRGFIDAIEKVDGVRIIDYKTSKAKDMTAEFRLQLGIYALLYKENFGQMPEKVSIVFVKGGELDIDVSEFLIVQAIDEIKDVQAKIKSTGMDDYPQVKSGLCKWHSGQCDFYEKCFGSESLE